VCLSTATPPVEDVSVGVLCPPVPPTLAMLLTGPPHGDSPPHPAAPRMKPLVPSMGHVEPVSSGATVQSGGPAEVSIHKTVLHPSTPPCLPLGYCSAPLRSSPPGLGSGHPREGQQASLLGGKYLLLEALEDSSLHRCLHIPTQEELVCKVVSRETAGQSLLSAHYRVDGHPRINPIQEVVVGVKHIYLVFPPCHGDMHCYVRTRRRLREPNARHLFRQIVAAVHEAHCKGIVLRDLKLRKFVFTDESRTEVKLESLEDAVVLEDYADDLLSDKHGCPAYVSPEILRTNSRYSGRAADMWGLGVMLYTMLVGRYPFHGAEHSGLFAKIRRGQFSLPDSLSSRAKCLIKCLLRKEPGERISTEDVLVHPWLVGSHRERGGGTRRSPHSDSGDQAVPIFSPSVVEERRGPLYLATPSTVSPILSDSSLARPSEHSSPSSSR
jgi:tribbles-like protein